MMTQNPPWCGTAKARDLSSLARQRQCRTCNLPHLLQAHSCQILSAKSRTRAEPPGTEGSGCRPGLQQHRDLYPAPLLIIAGDADQQAFVARLEACIALMKVPSRPEGLTQLGALCMQKR